MDEFDGSEGAASSLLTQKSNIERVKKRRGGKTLIYFKAISTSFRSAYTIHTSSLDWDSHTFNTVHDTCYLRRRMVYYSVSREIYFSNISD